MTNSMVHAYRAMQAESSKTTQALTDNQAETLEYVRSHFKRHGSPPTYKQIGDALALSPQGARVHVLALIRKGFLRQAKGRSCALPDTQRPAPSEAAALDVVLAEILALRAEVARLSSLLTSGAADESKRAYSPEDVAKASGTTRSAVYEAIARGDLVSFKAGKRRLVLSAELNNWLRRMADSNAR